MDRIESLFSENHRHLIKSFQEMFSENELLLSTNALKMIINRIESSLLKTQHKWNLNEIIQKILKPTKLSDEMPCIIIYTRNNAILLQLKKFKRYLYSKLDLTDINVNSKIEKINLENLFDEIELKIIELTAKLENTEVDCLGVNNLSANGGICPKIDKCQYRSLFETMAQGVVFQSEDGSIKAANPAAQNILGLTFDQMIGRTSTDPRWHAIHEDGRPFPGEEHPSMVSLRTGQKISNEVMGVFNPSTDEYKWINVSSIPQFKENADKPHQVYAAFTDISSIKKAEMALSESEKQYRLLFETMAQGVVYQDKDGHITKVNPKAEEILGLSFDQMRGRTSLDPRWHTIHEDGSPFPGEEHPAMVSLRTGRKVENVVIGIFNPQLEAYKWANVSSVPQFRENEKTPYQVYATLEDITQTKIVTEALKESEARYRGLFENMSEGFALHENILDENNNLIDYRYLNVNPAFEKLLKLKKESILNKRLTEIFPELKDDSTDWIRKYNDVAVNGNSYTFEEYSEGLQKWFRVHAFSPKPNQFATIFSDITSSKLAEAELQKFAKAKETLLREVNHRVKNNLFALLSLLHKELDKAKEKGFKDIESILNDLASRVRGLSSVHSMLSNSGWGSVNCGLLCEKIVSETIESMTDSEGFDLVISQSDSEVFSEAAHHLTLILNELATNSVKHAKNNEKKLAITISIEQKHENIRIIYSDNGKGYPDKILNGHYSETSVGFQLLKGIVEPSLAGNINFSNDNGAVTTICFDPNLEK